MNRTYEDIKKDVYEEYEKDTLLQKSPILDLEQQYACISVIGPKLPQKHDQMQIMLRGNCSSLETCNKTINKTCKEHPSNIGVYAVEMHCWLYLPPTEETMNSPDKLDTALYSLITDNIIDQEMTKKEYDNRIITEKEAAIDKVAKDKKEKELNSPDDISGADVTDDISGLTISPSDVKISEDEGYEEQKESCNGPVETPWDPTGPNYALNGQKYGVISIISNTDKDIVAIKIFEAYETIDDAKTAALNIQGQESMFNVHVVEMYKWLPLPPDLSKLENSFFIDEGLNTLVQSHLDANKKTAITQMNN